MASTATSRILAAVAALPLALGIFGGVAQAGGHAGSYVDSGHSAIVGQVNAAKGANFGNTSQTQQVVNGDNGTNVSNTAIVEGRHNFVSQANTTITFGPMWW